MYYPEGYPNPESSDKLEGLNTLGIGADDRTPNDPSDQFFATCFDTSVERVVWRTVAKGEADVPTGTSGVINSLIAGAEVQGASRSRMVKSVRKILHSNMIASGIRGLEDESAYFQHVMWAGEFAGSVLRSALVGFKDSVVRYHTQD